MLFLIKVNSRVAVDLQYIIGLCMCALLACGCSSSTAVFKDDFNTAQSYHAALTKNATAKEYGANALSDGHLLKKWNYSWEYSYEGDWTQAFYAVPNGKDYLEQAGRSAHSGNYRIITKTKVPDTAKKYEIQFRQFKNDNDAIFYLIGTDEKGDGGVKFGYMNQLPDTDHTVDTVYMRGDLGNSIIAGKSYFRRWATHNLVVNIETREITWKVNNDVVLTAKTEKLTPGGYFALSQHYERGTRYDDFTITILK